MIRQIIKNQIEKIKYKADPINYCRRKGVRIGEGCRVLCHYPFGTEPYLITLGNYVHLSGGVQFFTHDGGVWVIKHHSLWRGIERIEDIDLLGRIDVGNNVYFGQNAIILRNVKIGNNVIVGAGAVVTGTIPDNCVAAGVPAKVICSIEEYKAKHMLEVDYTSSFDWREKKEYLLKRTWET